jgi:hypothetical protein
MSSRALRQVSENSACFRAVRMEAVGFVRYPLRAWEQPTDISDL